MDGATATLDPSQSTLSPNFAQYVYNMLGKGEAAANLPFQPYTGDRFAGPSALQTQAFQGLAGLQMPGQFGMATDMLTRAGQQAQGMGYSPSTFGNFFQAPGAYQTGQFNAAYQAPTIGGPTQFQSTFQAPSAYQPGQISTGLGPVGSVQSYMSPYQSAVSDIEAREAQRQADIARQSRGARYAQAGAFGGARQAIEEAEAQRNLATQIGDIRSRGLQSAYDRALQQRAQEAQLGMTAQEATERARQFGATQGLNTAQLQAQYGLSAQQAQELSRQFNLGQQMSAAQLRAQFGLDAQKAQELSRQFGAQQALQAATTGAQYGLAGAQQTEASRQFAAQYGLDALRQQMAAAQALGALGTSQYGQQLQGLQALLGAGATQREIAQQPLDFGYQQFQESLKYPYQQATFMQSLLQGLPLAARPYDTGQSGMSALLQGGLGGLALWKALTGNKD